MGNRSSPMTYILELTTSHSCWKKTIVRLFGSVTRPILNYFFPIDFSNLRYHGLRFCQHNLQQKNYDSNSPRTHDLTLYNVLIDIRRWWLRAKIHFINLQSCHQTCLIKLSVWMILLSNWSTEFSLKLIKLWGRKKWFKLLQRMCTVTVSFKSLETWW